MAAEATARGADASTRRGFLAFLGWGTMAVVGLQAAVAFIVYFWPRKLGTFGAKLSVGDPAQYKEGDVKYFVDGKFYLVRLGANDELVQGTSAVGGFLALYQKCVRRHGRDQEARQVGPQPGVQGLGTKRHRQN
jgi:hypothetical protein